VFVASGTTPEGLAPLFTGERQVHGVIVGSTLRREGRAGQPLDRARTLRFAEAFARWAAPSRPPG
jgi:predicted TIM-barrel enzyme